MISRLAGEDIEEGATRW